MAIFRLADVDGVSGNMAIVKVPSIESALADVDGVGGNMPVIIVPSIKSALADVDDVSGYVAVVKDQDAFINFDL